MSLKLLLASGNRGKLREFQILAAGSGLELDLLPDFAGIPQFPEDAPTFAENAAGKAMYYSRFSPGLVFADDSGLVVPALGGEPGVHSARYAGPGASNEQKIEKLLRELRGKLGGERAAYFVCVLAVATRGSATTIVSAKADGLILDEARGAGGFGYDPVFYFPPLGKTFAELSTPEKNPLSHRGKAFKRLIEALRSAAA